jgi:hypothetical protein
MNTFLYLDDDSERVSGTIQGFEQKDFLQIVHNQPQSSWEKQLDFIKTKENENSLDGLILDLRLDDYPNQEQGKADFRGTSLAQEIRTRQKESSLKEFPIILFSGNEKVKNSLESSGQDLFDLCLEKENMSDTSYIPFRNKFNALADGYKEIAKVHNDLKLLLNVETTLIDERFIFELENLSSTPIHSISRFLIYEFIEKQGILVNEQVLAARLGIDIENSQDWATVKESLSVTKYTGVFGEGWQRWWMPLVEKWWEETVKADTYLRSTSATERVELIKNVLQLENLIPASKIDKADSEDFWTVCKGYNRPLDPVDGLIIEGQEKLYPWQEPEYVSVDAALKRKNVDKWKKVAKIEEDHLKELQKIYKKAR